MKANEERKEYWRRTLAEAVAEAAKHGATEHIDNTLYAFEQEIRADQHEKTYRYTREYVDKQYTGKELKALYAPDWPINGITLADTQG